MTKSSGNPTSGSGSTNTPSLNTTPSWAGGGTGAGGVVQNIFDAPATKKFGGQILADSNALYNQGPKPFNKSLYAGTGAVTDQSLADMLSMDTSAYDGAMSGAMDYYGKVARGEMMGQDDPNYARLRQNAIDDTMTNVNAAFGSMGRNMGGSHVDTMTSSIGDMLAGMDYQRLQDDYARRDTATAALPGLLQAQMAPLQNRLGIGQFMDQDAQAALTGEYDLYERLNGAGKQHVADWLNILQGGSQNNGVLQPDAPWWQTLLGTGLNFAGSLLGGGN